MEHAQTSGSPISQSGGIQEFISKPKNLTNINATCNQPTISKTSFVGVLPDRRQSLGARQRQQPLTPSAESSTPNASDIPYCGEDKEAEKVAATAARLASDIQSMTKVGFIY